MYNGACSSRPRAIGATLAHIAVSTGFQDYIQRNKATDLKDVNFMELFQKFSAEEAKPRWPEPRPDLDRNEDPTRRLLVARERANLVGLKLFGSEAGDPSVIGACAVCCW